MKTKPTDSRLILLTESDNCLIAAARLPKGEKLLIEGEEITLETTIDLAHKLSRHALKKDEKVLRYGAIIGHVTADTPRGAHLHTHNLQSDYIPTYTHDADHAYVRH